MRLNSIKTYISVSLLAGAMFACSEDKLDTINKNPDNAPGVDAKFILTDAITSTAFSNVGGDFNHYFSSYVEHEVGVFNQLFNAEYRVAEVYSSATFNNTWQGVYSSLKNARIIIDKCSDEGTQSGNYTTKGMAEVLAALNAGLIADAFGDAPFSQAALPNLENGRPQYMTPELDSQESIYEAIFQYLDAAIEDLPKGDTHVSGAPTTQDILFRGNTDKWLKLAYGLKARYTMHLLNRAEDKEATLRDIVEYCNKAATTTADEAAFNVYDGNQNLNPCFDFFYSREYMAASASLAKKLIAREDPRLGRTFMSAVDGTTYNATQLTTEQAKSMELMAPNGAPEQQQQVYNTSIFGYAATAPTFLQSAHEVLFLKAEALVRLNRLEEAKATLKEAVVLGLLNMENSVSSAANSYYYGVILNDEEPVTRTTAESYFDNNVSPLFDANPLKETMIQKYLAFWGSNGESTETYNDVRRLKAEGNDFYEFENPGRFPLRAPYGSDDVTANPNVQEAYGDGQYVFTENVWWAGGTR